jgi:hypothetical protein
VDWSRRTKVCFNHRLIKNKPWVAKVAFDNAFRIYWRGRLFYAYCRDRISMK